MSNAKICDTCQKIFPEGLEGAVTGIGQFTKVVNGLAVQRQKSTDTCPRCASPDASAWADVRADVEKRVKQLAAPTREIFVDDEDDDVADTDESYKRAVGRPGYGA